MKTIFYTVIFLLAISFNATAQSKIMQMKQKNNFMLRMHQNQNLKSSNQNFGIKINPYWQNIDAPHFADGYNPQVKIISYNTVWAKLNSFSMPNEKYIIHTANGGKTWKLDSVTIADEFGAGTISPVDDYTCYASVYNGVTGMGGGIYKTTDGGDTWEKLNVFDDNSFPDFVYFYDAKNGLAVADGYGADSSYLRIYTTGNAGKTWQRVSKQNLPPVMGRAFSFVFQVYAVAANTIWFRAQNDEGNFYLYRSDDLGHHWQQYNSSPEYVDFAFSDKWNGLATGYDENGRFVANSHDGGKTFNKISYTGFPKDFIAAIPFTHSFVTTAPCCDETNGGSSYSNDYGKTWHLIDSGATANADLHTDVAFLNPFVGWTGQGFNSSPSGGMYKWKLHFSLDDNAIAVNDDNASSATKNNLSSTISARLYPNPAKDVIAINGLNPSIKTTLSLYTISGRLIQQTTTNSEAYQFSIQKLAAGSYYIKVQVNDKATTLQFIKE